MECWGPLRAGPETGEDVVWDTDCQCPYGRSLVEVLDCCEVEGGQLQRAEGHSKSEYAKESAPGRMSIQSLQKGIALTAQCQ